MDSAVSSRSWYEKTNRVTDFTHYNTFHMETNPVKMTYQAPEAEVILVSADNTILIVSGGDYPVFPSEDF